MKKINTFLTIVFLLVITSLSAQTEDKQIDNQLNTWLDYVGNHKITDKWGVHTLVSLRRNDFIANPQQFLARVGGVYHINKNMSAVLGYDYIETFSYGAQPIAENVLEHRIFEHLQMKHRNKNFYFIHRYRLAHRLSNDVWRHRFRYRFTVRLPLGKPNIEPNTLYLDAFNELFLNLGKSAKNRIFNQNWAAIGLGYKTDFGFTLRLSYMNQYLPKGDNIRVENNHTINLGIGYSFDWRKKEAVEK